MLIYRLEISLNATSSHKMTKKPKKGEYLEILLRSAQTIFSTKDAALLWSEDKKSLTSSRLNKYTKTGKLVRLRRGLYAKDKNYNKLELSTKIFRPSYVSFETVLGAAGITFQYYSQIFVASYQTREIELGSQKYVFKKIKDGILTSSIGIKNENGYSIATPERAFLDTLYINKKYHFDNLRQLDWEKVRDILYIYGGNKRMEKAVRELEARSKS